MASKLRPQINTLVQAIGRGDLQAFSQAINELGIKAQRSKPAVLTEALEELAPVLPAIHGIYSKVALLAGALVEAGGSPTPLSAVLPTRASQAMEDYARFRTTWPLATGGRPLPDHRHRPAMRDVETTLLHTAGRCGITEREARRTALAYYEIDDWLQAMITCLGDRRFRKTMTDRSRARAAAEAIMESVENASWVAGLLDVVDDEPLLVLDSVSGRGFKLVMSGIGDNYQLHTLLADLLAGSSKHQLAHYEKPEPAWVAAAKNRDPQVSGDSPILRRFRLFSADGTYVSPEGCPAQIPALNETRIVVLHPPQTPFGWTGGRAYEHMIPALTLEQELSAHQAEALIAQIIPPWQTDLSA